MSKGCANMSREAGHFRLLKSWGVQTCTQSNKYDGIGSECLARSLLVATDLEQLPKNDKTIKLYTSIMLSTLSKPKFNTTWPHRRAVFPNPSKVFCHSDDRRHSPCAKGIFVQNYQTGVAKDLRTYQTYL